MARVKGAVCCPRVVRHDMTRASVSLFFVTPQVYILLCWRPDALRVRVVCQNKTKVLFALLGHLGVTYLFMISCVQ